MVTAESDAQARPPPATGRRRAAGESTERFLAALCIFYYTGPIQAVFFYADDGLGPFAMAGPSEGARLAWLPAYAIILALSLARLPDMVRTLRANLPLLALLLLPLLSTAWSIEPGDSLRRGAALLASALLGIYLAARFRPPDLVRLLAWGLSPAVALSWLFVLAWPARGIMPFPFEGAWRGMFAHKNDLGQMMLLNVVVVLVALRSNWRYRWLLLGDLVLSLVLLVLANSKTYLIGGLVLGAAALVLTLWLRRSQYLIPVASLMAGIAVVAWANFDDLVLLAGRDPTLTGRTELWQALWPMIEQRIWLGYGYQAFWVDPLGPAGRVWSIIDWQAPNAHNGFLELWLGLGLVGMAAFAFILARASSNALAAIRAVDPTTAYWTLLFTTLFLLSGFSEINFLSQNMLLTVLFVATVAYWGTGGAASPFAAAAGDRNRRRRPIAAP